MNTTNQSTVDTASNKLTPLEKKWVLYDVANSAYVLLATALLSFYQSYVSPTNNLTSVWGGINTIVTIIAVFLCPVLGTLADFSHKRKFFIKSRFVYKSIGREYTNKDRSLRHFSPAFLSATWAVRCGCNTDQ